jgi:hypothetical protein
MQESEMQRLFIIAIMFLGITAAKGQTVVQLNGQTNSSETIGSDPLSIPASALPSGSGSRLAVRVWIGVRQRIGIISGERIGKRCLDFSIASPVAGGNAGYVRARSDYDRDGSRRTRAYLPAPGSHNRWRLGKPDRDSRRIA